MNYLAVAIVIMTVFAGCKRTPPFQQKVEAESTSAFSMWRAKMGERLTARERELVDKAVQELKFKVMAEGSAHGSTAIDQAVRRQIDGAILYDVVQLGLQERLNRLLTEKSKLERSTTIHTRLRTRPGDEESADVLKTIRADQARRLEKLESEISEAITDMNQLETSKKQ